MKRTVENIRRCSVEVKTQDYRSGPVVQKVDNAIHRINHYPMDSAIVFAMTYPLDSDLSGR